MSIMSYINCLKGGHVHNAFLAPILSLGDVETKTNILKFSKVAKMSYKICLNLHCNGFFRL